MCLVRRFCYQWCFSRAHWLYNRPAGILRLLRGVVVLRPLSARLTGLRLADGVRGLGRRLAVIFAPFLFGRLRRTVLRRLFIIGNALFFFAMPRRRRGFADCVREVFRRFLGVFVGFAERLDPPSR